METSLILVRPGSQKREVPLNRAKSVIGRRDDCQIRIPLSSVSRQHCELVNDGTRLSVRDLGSSNGTFVNRQKIVEQALKPGDLLAVGPCVFVVRINGQPDEIDPNAGQLGAAPVPGQRTPSGADAKTVSSKPGVAATSIEANEGSSEFGFDFDLDDDDDSQPKL